MQMTPWCPIAPRTSAGQRDGDPDGPTFSRRRDRGLPAATVASVTVSPSSATASLTGVQLTASTATHACGAEPVTWILRNVSIATVDATGEYGESLQERRASLLNVDGVSASAVITVPATTTTWPERDVLRTATRAQCSDTGTLDIVQAPSAPGFAATGTQGGFNGSWHGFANMISGHLRSDGHRGRS
jgi:hypothetical protein